MAEINVKANTGTARRAIDDLTDSVDKLGEAASDLGNRKVDPVPKSALGDINRVTDALNRLGRTVSSSTKSKFRLVDPQQAKDDLKLIEQQFEQLKRQSQSLRNALRFSGQQGAGFGDVDWGRLHADPRRAAELRNRAYGYATRGTSFALAEKSQGDPSFLREALIRIARHGGYAGGELGRLAGGAATAANEGGGFSLGTGLRFGALGLLGLGAFKAVSAVSQGVDRAGAQNQDLDLLKRQMGDLGVSFRMLQEAADLSAQGLGINSNESAKLLQEFNRLSGGVRTTSELMAEVRNSVGFDRSFGLTTGRSGQFFASMRQYGVTGSEQGNRQLAMQIGETIAKSGMTGKADEVLAAIQDFTTATAQHSLTSVNVGDYSALYAGLSGSGLPGLRGAGAASLINAANSAMMNMGAAGEAGQNFTLSAFSRYGRLNPIQAAVLAEGGLFGNRNSAFGSGSAYGRYLSSKGRRRAGQMGAAPAMNNLSVIQQALTGLSGDPDLQLDAAKRYFGLSSYGQAAALMSVKPTQLGGLSSLLTRSGVSIGSVNETGIKALTDIAGATSIDQLRGISSGLRGRKGDGALSDAEKIQLSSLEKNGTFDQLQQALAKIAAGKEQEQTDATRQLKASKDIESAITGVGRELIGPINTMREALLSLSKMGPKKLHERVAQMERDDAAESHSDARSKVLEATEAKKRAARKRYEAVDQELSLVASGRKLGNLTPAARKAYIDRLMAEQGRYQPGIDALNADQKTQLHNLDTQYAQDIAAINQRSDEAAKAEGLLKGKSPLFSGAPAVAAQAAAVSTGPNKSSRIAYLHALEKQYGLPQGALVGVWGTESSFGANTKRSSAGAMGNFQFLPETARRYGVQFGNFESEASGAGRYLADLRRRHGGDLRGALLDYNGVKTNVAAGNKYLADVQHYGGFSLQGTPLPAGDPLANATPQQTVVSVRMDGQFRLVDASGKPVANTVEINKQVNAPRAYGMGG